MVVLAMIFFIGNQTGLVTHAAELDIDKINQLIIEEVNNLRAQNGLNPVVRDEVLMNYAKGKASVQAVQGYLDHESGDPIPQEGYSLTAENLAQNYLWATEEETAIEFVKQYYIDEGVPTLGHRKNMLNPYITRIGVGIAKASDGKLYNAMNLGTQTGGITDFAGALEYLDYCKTTEERPTVYDKVDGPAAGELAIVDNQGVKDGIITVYPYRDGATYNLELTNNGMGLTPEQIKDVTWTVEAIAGFEGKGIAATIANGTNEFRVVKSGIVRVTATYQGESTSIDIVAPGDVNRDGVLDSSDASAIFSIGLSGMSILPANLNDKYTLYLLDVNNDGTIDSADASSAFGLAMGQADYVKK